MAAFPFLVESPKSIAFFPGWSAPEVETSYIWFNAPLEIDGATEPGLVFHGGCYADLAEANVAFTLDFTHVGSRRKTPLIRLEWRCLSGGHSNPRKCPNSKTAPRTDDTHIHSFELNWIAHLGRLRGDNLPCAENVDKSLNSFQELLEYAGNRFNINNIGVVKPPPWEYRFL